MKVTAQFHYGYSYAPPFPDDVEEFDSLRAALSAFAARCDFDPYYPCTDESATVCIAYGHTDYVDCPDRVYGFGPRGGVIRLM